MKLALVNGAPGGGLSPWDRGFLYGDGAFETLRTYGGRLFALEPHLALLEETARSLHIEARDACARLRVEAHEALRLAGPGEWLLRLLLTRGEGAGAGLAAATGPTRVILVEPLRPLPEEVYRQGVEAESRFHPGGTLGPKTLAYLPQLLALDGARSRGAGEVLLVDEAGGLGQGSTCNLLLVRGSSLIAPAPAGGRAGVTRASVLAQAGGLGLRAESRPIRRDELGEGSELLLCSTIREVLPVVAVDGVRVGEGRPGEAAGALRRALRRAAGE